MSCFEVFIYNIFDLSKNKQIVGSHYKCKKLEFVLIKLHRYQILEK